MPFGKIFCTGDDCAMHCCSVQNKSVNEITVVFILVFIVKVKGYFDFKIIFYSSGMLIFKKQIET